jgi:hypothetical protein
MASDEDEDEDSAHSVSQVLPLLASAVSMGSPDAGQLTKLSNQIMSMVSTRKEMRPNDALRSLELLSEGAAQLEARSGKPGSAPYEPRELGYRLKAAQAVRTSMQLTIASITDRFFETDVRFVAEVLTVMATTGVGLQEYYDAMLARLHVLLRTNPHSFAPHVCARVMGALGRARADGGIDDFGLGAQATGCQAIQPATSYERQEANRRFLVAFNTHLRQALPAFLEDDIGALHEAYCTTYMGDEELRRLLYRSAQLQVGLLPESEDYLGFARRLVTALGRKRSDLMAALPAFTTQYCERLATASTSQVLQS